MYWKSVVIIIFFSVFFSSNALADKASHRAAVEELLILSNQDKMVDQIWGKVSGILEKQYQKMGSPERLKPIFEKYNDKMFKVMEKELSFENMKEDLMEVYLHTFTEDEAIAITKFYKSPAGKIFLEKMPELANETMLITQKKMPRMMVEIRTISKEMAQEIKDLQAKHQS